MNRCKYIMSKEDYMFMVEETDWESCRWTMRRKFPLDGAITDKVIIMPGGRGIEVLAVLEEREHGATTLSSRGVFDMVEKAISCATKTLSATQPEEMEDVRQVMREWMSET